MAIDPSTRPTWFPARPSGWPKPSSSGTPSAQAVAAMDTASRPPNVLRHIMILDLLGRGCRQTIGRTRIISCTQLHGFHDQRDLVFFDTPLASAGVPGGSSEMSSSRDQLS